MLIQYELKEELFRSTKGSVWLCRRKSDGHLTILKERRSAELGRGKDVQNELSLLRKLRHDYLIRLETFFFENATLYMELERSPCGDLRCEVEKRQQGQTFFSVGQVLKMMAQVLSCVSFLHENRIIHRDIKSSNIFIFPATKGTTTVWSVPGLVAEYSSQSSFFNLKIGDLGVSRECSEDTCFVRSFYGTPLYASPEICENLPYTFATDVWSSGVLFYELTCLAYPFPGSSMMKLVREICQEPYQPLPGKPNATISSCIDGMLQKNPKQRPSVQVLCSKVKEEIVLQNRQEALRVTQVDRQHDQEAKQSEGKRASDEHSVSSNQVEKRDGIPDTDEYERHRVLNNEKDSSCAHGRGRNAIAPEETKTGNSPQSAEGFCCSIQDSRKTIRLKAEIRRVKVKLKQTSSWAMSADDPAVLALENALKRLESELDENNPSPEHDERAIESRNAEDEKNHEVAELDTLRPERRQRHKEEEAKVDLEQPRKQSLLAKHDDDVRLLERENRLAHRKQRFLRNSN